MDLDPDSAADPVLLLLPLKTPAGKKDGYPHPGIAVLCFLSDRKHTCSHRENQQHQYIQQQKPLPKNGADGGK